jgi:hypothetical protein
MRRSLLLLLLVVATLCLAACGGAAAPTATQPAPARATATSPKAAEIPLLTATKQPGATAAEDTLSLKSRDQGLDKLKSYRMRWQSHWTTTESGKSDKGDWMWTAEYTASPLALHYIWTFSDATDSGSGQMATWQIGDTVYISSAGGDDAGKCVAMSRADQSNSLASSMFTPSVLGSLSGAKYVGTDTVNGIRAKHYVYTEQSASLVGFGKVAGDAWVAVDGGYIVKDTMTWEGSAGPFGGSSTGKGKGSWTWELSDVNQPITIKAPENCSSGAADLPVMADATSKTTVSDMLTYTTPSKPADVVAFYKKEMAKAGWTASEEWTTTGQLTNLEFVKGGQTASLTVVSSNQGTTVMITLSEGE